MSEDTRAHPHQPTTEPTERELWLDGIEGALRAHVSVPLRVSWSPLYNPAWNATPERYVEGGAVEWGRSRRLAKIEVPAYAFKSYLGIQAWDPGRWNLSGAAEAKFFLSTFAHGHTLAMRTFPGGVQALDALAASLDGVERTHRSSSASAT